MEELLSWLEAEELRLLGVEIEYRDGSQTGRMSSGGEWSEITGEITKHMSDFEFRRRIPDVPEVTGIAFDLEKFGSS